LPIHLNLHLLKNIKMQMLLEELHKESTEV
jgi:hypothetical protein